MTYLLRTKLIYAIETPFPKVILYLALDVYPQLFNISLLCASVNVTECKHKMCGLLFLCYIIGHTLGTCQLDR